MVFVKGWAERFPRATFWGLEGVKLPGAKLTKALTMKVRGGMAVCFSLYRGVVFTARDAVRCAYLVSAYQGVGGFFCTSPGFVRALAMFTLGSIPAASPCDVSSTYHDHKYLRVWGRSSFGNGVVCLWSFFDATLVRVLPSPRFPPVPSALPLS